MNYTRAKTPHQQRVEALMFRAHQAAPDFPCEPSEAVRILRARLIVEEVLETLDALGVKISIRDEHDEPVGVGFEDLEFAAVGTADIVDVADGCADISVVTIGTLSAFGIADDVLLALVDYNNLAKFGPGHSYNEFGKLLKPAGHKPPDIEGLLRHQVQDAGVDAVEAARMAGQGCAD